MGFSFCQKLKQNILQFHDFFPQELQGGATIPERPLRQFRPTLAVMELLFQFLFGQ